MSETPSYVKNCVTHHNACDCREYLQQKKIDELEKELERMGMLKESCDDLILTQSKIIKMFQDKYGEGL
jgi:ethanolamine ammonia-lyase large subunit